MHSLMRAGAVTLGFILFASAGVAQAQVVVPVEPAPPPPQNVVVVPPAQQAVVATDTESSPRNELIVSGLMSFGISYGAAVAVAATSNHEGDNHLYVPVVGPWLDLGNRGSCNVNLSSCDGETTNKVLLVVDGIFQGAGVLAVVGGVLTPTPTHTVVSDTKVHVAPVSYGEGEPGLAAFGKF